MSNIPNDPTFGLIGHSTMGRGRIELVTAEDIEGSEGIGAMNAATIADALYRGKRKEGRKIIWKVGEMGTHTIRIGELSRKEIERDTKKISTEAGVYVNANLRIDFPTNAEPYNERVTFKEICYGEKILKLKFPIEAEGMLSGEGHSLYYEPLNISVSAPTLDECEEDFQEEFNVLYEVYAKEVNEKLTKGAQELKRKILNLVMVEP
ncbi:MAG: hypothetical protein WBC40_08985 [Halobacteriota archaeon]